MSTSKLAAWWARRNLQPIVRQAAKVLPLRDIGEALVSYGATIMLADGARVAEIEDVVIAAAVDEPDR